MKFSDWPLLIPLVQGVINHTPSRVLKGMAPVTVFTGLPAERPFRYIFDSERKEFRSSRMTEQEITLLHEGVCLSLQDMHKKVIQTKSLIREQTRKQRNQKNKVKKINFGIGDFVLVSRATSQDKLSPRWTGPYEILDSVNEQVFVVRNLLDGTTAEVHAVRIMFYSDELLDVDSHIKDHLVYQNDSFMEVESISNDRVINGIRQVLVHWRGFEEPTWELEESIREDVPNLLEVYLDSKQ
jgi:hypothetical protein